MTLSLPRAARLTAWPAVALAAALLLNPLTAPRAAAEGLRDHAVSLNAVPADAAFYAAWLRGAEQWEAATKTNAWRRLTSIPFLQMGWMQVQTQWQFPTDPNVQAVKAWVEGPDGERLLGLLGEMFSEEVFIVGDDSFNRMLTLALEMQSLVNREQYRAIGEDFSGDSSPEEVGQEAAKKVLALMAERKDDFVVPGVVIGFRIQDRAQASELLDLAETELRKLARLSPIPIDDRFARDKSGENDLLTFTLTEDMLPWEEIEANFDGPEEMLEQIKSLLDGKKAVVSLGVVRDFLVLSVGGSADVFEDLGSGPLLADTKEFKRLDQHAGERLTSIGYASAALMQANSAERTIRDLSELGTMLLGVAEISHEQRNAIQSDVNELVDTLVEVTPKAAALATVAFETDRGYEGYQYNWGEMAGNVDGSKPLTLIDHVGADSLGWFVSRAKQSVADYDTFIGWVKRFSAHFEAIAEEKAEPDDWQQYASVREQVLPLLERLNKATRDALLPAMADGQGAIVLDASFSDANWCEFMPAAGAELPLPTIATVSSVSDQRLLKQAVSEYFAVAQDALEQAQQVEPDKIPPISIPEPAESVLAGGTIYRYDLPPMLGASSRLAPNACLGESVLVLSVMPELSEKLLSGGGPGLDGPLADFDRPLAFAGHFKFSRFVDILDPWIDYGLQVAIEQAGDQAAGQVAMIGMFKPQLGQLLDVISVWDSSTVVTYRDGDVWVTHSEVRIIDLEE